MFIKSIRLIVVAGVIALTTSSLRAQVWTEVGDAGQTLPGAQATGAVNGNPLTTIVGTLSSGTDADIYVIMITSPTTFSATTNNAVTQASGLDTALFLFNGSGVPIYTNDDVSGVSLQSTLPAGTAFTLSLSPGVYYLAVSLSGNEPVNLTNQLLFAGYPLGDTTAVRGPASGVSPNVEANFNGGTFFSQTGGYQINLTGAATAAAVPEASTIALTSIGIAGLWSLRKRNRKFSLPFRR